MANLMISLDSQILTSPRHTFLVTTVSHELLLNGRLSNILRFLRLYRVEGSVNIQKYDEEARTSGKWSEVRMVTSDGIYSGPVIMGMPNPLRK